MTALVLVTIAAVSVQLVDGPEEPSTTPVTAPSPGGVPDAEDAPVDDGDDGNLPADSDQGGGSSAAVASATAAGGPEPATASSVFTREYTIAFDEPTPVNRVRLMDTAEVVPTSATLALDGGTPEAVALVGGSMEATIPERVVSTATLSLTARRALPAIDWALDRIVTEIPASGGIVAAPWASSNGGGVGGLALADGDPAAGATGAEWGPNPTDSQPSVGFFFDTPTAIASMQVMGPSATSFDPAYSAAASLYGTLVFSDGSRIAVSGIEGGDTQPTTIAFAPRTVTSVVLELRRTVSSATLGIREFAVFRTGVTPPRWPTTGPRYSVSAVPADCSTVTAPAARDALRIVCPATGRSISGRFTVVAAGRAGASVEARAWDPRTRAEAVLSRQTVAGDGLVRLELDAESLLAGPMGVQIRYVGGTPSRTPVVAQLVNRGGIVDPSVTAPPSGRTLQWEEQFRDGLSVSQAGLDSVYGSTKPAYWGTSEFGEAIFADPLLGAGTLAVLDREYLRIRAQPRGQIADPYGWGRSSASGMLSSLKIGGTGFAAQYGYFEARILAPGGTGTWPAFWMLNSESTANRSKTTSAEIDAVELYGHDTTASCHSLHAWTNGSSAEQKRCLWPNGATDWSMSWHTYAVDVRPDGVRYLIDGREVARFAGLTHADEPFYYMLNLALGGGYPIDLSPTGGVADMYVDWVRVYT